MLHYHGLVGEGCAVDPLMVPFMHDVYSRRGFTVPCGRRVYRRTVIEMATFNARFGFIRRIDPLPALFL